MPDTQTMLTTQKATYLILWQIKAITILTAHHVFIPEGRGGEVILRVVTCEDLFQSTTCLGAYSRVKFTVQCDNVVLRCASREI